jgi:hypothetical protein
MSLPEKHYHAVQFYKDEHSLAGTVARFLAEGLSSGEPSIIIATPSHSDLILKEVSSLGLDTDERRRTGELHILDASKALSSFMVGGMVGGTPDPVKFKLHVGNAIEALCAGRRPCPIRAYGEMVDILWQEGNCDGAIKLELLWNQLAITHEFALLCGYAFGHFYKETSEARYKEVCDQHSEIYPAS